MLKFKNPLETYLQVRKRMQYVDDIISVEPNFQAVVNCSVTVSLPCLSFPMPVSLPLTVI